FAEKKLPVYFFFTGLHNEYHKPSDTVDTINFPGMNKIVELTEDVLERLVTMKERPAYVQTQAQTRGGGRADGPRIGFMPGKYDDAENKGVLIGGVTQGGPAEKGGLKQGDYIVEIAGKPVKNMTAYMTIMAGQKKGEPLELTVDREGKKIKLTVKPEESKRFIRRLRRCRRFQNKSLF